MIRFHVTKAGVAAIGKRGFQEIGRTALRFVAEHWWKVYLPLHFQTIAFLRYRFAARDARTNQYKRERRPWPFGEHTAPASGEVKPMVFTGYTRERVTSAPNIHATAPNFQTYRAEVRLDAPALNFSAGKRIDLRDEITRDTPQEHVSNERLFHKHWNRLAHEKGLKATPQTKTIAA
jgi:hypothetical protein